MIASRQGPTATNTPIDSKGEAVSTSLTQQIENTRSSKCISFVFGFGEDSPIEATGLSLDACGRAAVLISAILIGPALLQLASDAAGCNKTNIDDTYSECELKIYGFRPSSLLTNIGAISGAIVAIFLPLFGSIVDHTSYRRQIGLLTAAAITTLKVIQISVGPSTWFAIAILQVIIHLLYNFHITGSYAYISELTTDPTKLSRYNSSFFTTLFIVMVTFLIVVVGISMILGVDDVGTARISQILVTIVCTVSWSIAWLYYFQDRPAASQVPEGMSLLTCGFRKNIDTVRTIVGSNSALALLLLSVAFAEASSAAIITVGTTYMKEVLHMDADEIGLVILVVVISGAPGSIFGYYVTKYFKSPLPSIIACNLMSATSTLVGAFTLLRPEHKNRFYIFAVFWGMSIGWMHPQHITAFSSMIPSGQEAELMGILLFSVICLEWMPPLVFSAFNEAGFPMSWGLASLSIFYSIAIVFNLLVAMVNRSWLVSSAQYTRENHHKSNASTLLQENHHKSNASTLLQENQATLEIYEDSNQ